MATKYSTPTLVVNIKRQFFAEILAKPPRKIVEYRKMKEYWERRLEKVGKPPFNLRLLNGMHISVKSHSENGPCRTARGEKNAVVGIVL